MTCPPLPSVTPCSPGPHVPSTLPLPLPNSPPCYLTPPLSYPPSIPYHALPSLTPYHATSPLPSLAPHSLPSPIPRSPSPSRPPPQLPRTRQYCPAWNTFLSLPSLLYPPPFMSLLFPSPPAFSPPHSLSPHISTTAAALVCSSPPPFLPLSPHISTAPLASFPSFLPYFIRAFYSSL
ncbi:hypothetical protein Pcinc_036821 [Petrolisthes cinctipes]|uniref:Uncharacterized protein n=1 Tax=Petrolisthes cinctipes TaxID=88211 RepID=A0AAE1BVD9_PETCI|nr:hypothetical protein Pcinc_036821 [Petrolisthes cinctipes]